jgi:hypothetical protein
LSARDYLIQFAAVLLAGGAVVGVRFLVLRREKPRKRAPTRKKASKS